MEDELKQKLQEYGFSSSDIGKGMKVLEISGGSLNLLIFGACYFFRPTRTFIRVLKLVNQENLNNGGLFSRKSVACVEMIAIRTIISPIWLPIKLWVTFKIVKYWNKFSENNLEEGEIKVQEDKPVDELIENEKAKDE